MQETYREEDYAVQLIEGFYPRVVLVTTLFWGNIDRFCICGWKFPRRFCARHLVVTKPCLTLQRVSTKDASVPRGTVIYNLVSLGDVCLYEHSYIISSCGSGIS